MGYVRFLAVVALLFAVALPAFPQAAAINGLIEGTVTDPTGAAVAGATVTVLNTGTGFTRTLTTDESGLYRFNVLPLGTYRVSIQAAGFEKAQRDGVELSAGRFATLDIQLSLAGTKSEIVVTEAAPITEPGRTDLGSTLSTNQVVNLPLLSRNPYNFILVQPNVSGRPNTEFGVPRKVNANGFNDRINYQLDGGNNTQSDRAGIRLLPISNTFVAEVQNVSNGFAPEFGNTVGTVFNTITKSGANDLHGEAAYIFRRKDFNARPTLLSPSSPKPELSVDSYQADAGGHIIKDKLFWFGAFEHVGRDLPSVVTVSPATVSALGLPARYANAIPFSQNVYFYMGKADWQISSNHRLTGRFNYFRNESPYNNGGGQTVESQTYLFKDRAPSWALQLISTLSPNTVNELRFSLPKRYQRQVSFDGTGAQPVTNISGLINFGGSPSTGLRFIEQTPEVSENFTWNHGTHSWKFGAQIRNIRDDNTDVTYARYTFPSLAAYQAALSGADPRSYSNYTQTFGNPQIKYNSLFSGFYAQDNWKIRPNLSLIYGLRYDVYKIPDADSKAPLVTSQNFSVDKNNFAPRLGIVWEARPGTVIRANAGIFYDAPQTDVYRRALLNNGNPQYFAMSTGPATPYAPAFPTVLTGVPTGFALSAQDVVTVSPNFRTLYSSNANVQITQQIVRDTSLSLSYLYTKGSRLPVYRNVNILPTGATLADGRPIFGSTRIDPRFANVLMAESVGNSNYNGLNVRLDRRFSHGFETFVTYTWSHALDDAPEQNVLDSSNFLPSDPTNRRRDYGNSLSDRRHAFTWSGVFEPKFDTGAAAVRTLANNNRLALLFVATSGDVFNIGSNRVVNGDQSIATAQQRPLFIGRNTVRGPGIYQLDLRYSRVFPIRERWRLEFLGEFTNLLNHANITGLNTTATVDATGAITAAPNYAPTAALDSRLMQLGFRMTF